jgi:hypothetical protein
MHREFLLGLCAHPRDATLRRLARAVLDGDFAALVGIWDRLHEVGEVPMQALRVGECYLIRTVTHYYTGRVKSVSFTEVVLGEAAWIPDTGRYHEALRTGSLAEVEPYPDEVIVATAAIVDAARWDHPLPREPK